jgi:hypothetical protein
MSESDVRERLHDVITLLGVPAQASEAAGGGGSPSDEEAQRIATRLIDRLLPRVSMLTGMLERSGSEWGDVERLTAEQLLSDLTVIATATRTVNRLAGERLTSAAAALAAARQDAERSLREAS